MKKRKTELMQYLKTLMQLKDIGVDYDDKIKVVLDELHREMGFTNGIVVSVDEIKKISNEEVKEIAKAIKKKMEEEDAKEEHPNMEWVRTFDAKDSSAPSKTENPFDTIE